MFYHLALRGQVALNRLALLVVLSVGIFASQAAQAELSRGPYLQQATPQSMVIVWRTNHATVSSVRVGNSPESLNRRIAGESVLLRVSVDVEAAKEVPRLYQEPKEDTAKRNPRDNDPSTVASTYQYEVSIDSLSPATRYYYGIYDGDQCLAGGDKEHYFETLPVAGSDADLRIWVVGDSGTGERDQKEVYLAMQEFTQKTKRDLDLYIHVGDMAYGDGTDPQFQHNFFEIYQPTLRNKVCWPAMGNHEGHTSRGISNFGPYYDAYVVPMAAEAGGLPSGTEAYYSFDIADVHFVCLDSHDLDRTPDGAMAQWLVADLEEAQGEWLVAFWHHPPYTKGSHDSDAESQLIEMRTHFMPILEASGVDIVLSGHSHIYERSMLIDGAYATPTVAEGVVVDDGDGHPDGDGAYRKSQGMNPHEGTVAVVSGHGGAGLTRRGTMPIMREVVVEHGSLVLDIKGDTLVGTMINKNNVTRDVFSIVKRGKVEVTYIEKPWQLPNDLSEITVFRVSFQDYPEGQPPSGWSVAHGSPEAMTVSRDQLAVTATEEPVVVLYDEFQDYITGYETRITLSANSTAPSGLVFAYQDEKNYYAYRLNAKSRMAEMVRWQNGEETVLTSRKVDIDFNRSIKIVIEPLKKLIEVHLNNDLEYSVDLKEPLPEGKLGALVGANSKVRYRYFITERGQP